jgi:hypothetical protein
MNGSNFSQQRAAIKRPLNCQCCNKISYILSSQGDQIGQNFAIWQFFIALGNFFLEKIAQ